MAAHPGVAAVQKSAFDALSVLVMSPAAASLAVDQGIVQTTVDVLRTHAQDEERCAQVRSPDHHCHALLPPTASNAAAQAVRKQSPPVAISPPAPPPRLPASQACLLLGDLAHGEPEAAAAAPALPAVLEALDAHRGSPTLQRAALCALAGLAAAPDSRAQLLRPEVVEAALGALADDRGAEWDLPACFLLGRLGLHSGFADAALAARPSALSAAAPASAAGEPVATALLVAALRRAQASPVAGYAVAALDTLRTDPRALVKESAATSALRAFLFESADAPPGSPYLEGDPIRTAVVVAEQAGAPAPAKRACDVLVAVASLGGAAALRVADAGAMRATVAIMAQVDSTSHASAIALVDKLSTGSHAGEDSLAGTMLLPQMVQMLGSPTADVRAAAASAVSALAQGRCGQVPPGKL